ncbi:IS66 family insertion sequence element accessory protein TnpB, partial [Thiolapillus sp.]
RSEAYFVFPLAQGTPGKQCGLAATGVYQPSLRSPWLAAEDNGFVLYYKSLAEEKFHWPGGEEELVSLTGQQINWLLDGYDLRAMKGHKKLHYEATF